MPLARNRAHSRIGALVALILLCVFWSHALSVASATSMTVDEGLHIASGYTIWRTGDYRLIEEHPPLVKLWLALPLLPIPDLGDPMSMPAWEDAAQPTTESLPLLQMAQQLLYPYRPVARWLYPARTMSALLGVLLLATIARWSRETAGFLGSLFVLGLASFDPNLLAHAAIAGTDLGAATLITLGLWRASHFLHRPTRRRMWGAGVALGLSLASKLTAMLLGPPLALVGLLRLIALPPDDRWRLVRQGLGVVAISVFVLWGAYSLQVTRLPGTAVQVPAAAHSIPILRLLAHDEDGHQAFLLGRNSTRGWWYYFPIAFLIKTPLAALLAMSGSLAIYLARLRKASRTDVAALIGSPAIWFVLTYGAASALSSLNIGYRHLLPILPVLYVGTAQLAGRSRIVGARTGNLHVVVLGVLLAGQLGATLAQTPHLLTFFNVAVGGAAQGWRYLADSNTDWGQAYKALATYQEDHHLTRVNLAAFIFYDPAIYGVAYTPLPPLGGDTPAIFPSRLAPAAGDYVISATPLDGIPTADEAMYDWFRWRTPDAQVGDALFVYHVGESEIETRWVAQCITPTAPLDAEAIAVGFGRLPERSLTFDCGQTWLYPAAERGPGAFVLHGALLEDSLPARLHLQAPGGATPFIEAQLANSSITYWQRAYREVPSFAVFRSEQPPEEIEGMLEVGQPAAPIALDGPLDFLGATPRRVGTGYEVETWWRVRTQPSDRPFSIMGHMASVDGSVIGVSDGLGVAHALLLPGDVVVQRHVFEADRAKDPWVFQTGVYWLDTMERWALLEAIEGIPSATDFIPIPFDGIR